MIPYLLAFKNICNSNNSSSSGYHLTAETAGQIYDVTSWCKGVRVGVSITCVISDTYLRYFFEWNHDYINPLKRLPWTRSLSNKKGSWSIYQPWSLGARISRKYIYRIHSAFTSVESGNLVVSNILVSFTVLRCQVFTLCHCHILE